MIYLIFTLPLVLCSYYSCLKYLFYVHNLNLLKNLNTNYNNQQSYTDTINNQQNHTDTLNNQQNYTDLIKQPIAQNINCAKYQSIIPINNSQ